MDVASKTQFSIDLLGQLRLSRDGVAIPPPTSQKSCELLVLLVLARGVPHPRKELAAMLWPADDHSDRMTNLRQRLMQLRKALGEEAARIQEQHHALRFDSVGVAVDAFRFRTLIAEANRSDGYDTRSTLASALDLYTGPLFPAGTARSISRERDELQKLFVAGLETLAEHQIQAGDPEGATGLLQRAIKCDPCRDTAIRLLLNVLEERPTDAEREFEQFRNARVAANRWPPEPDLMALYDRIRERAMQERLQARTVGREINAEPVHRQLLVPVALNSLIGHEEDLTRIATQLLRSRLVTLTGPGGMGKTRLAVEVTGRREHAYRDGAVFVDLSGLPVGATLDMVAQKVLSTLEIRESAAVDALDAVAAFLAPKHFLLVLDNCEQMTLSCATFVRHILSRCRDVHFLVTSREALQVGGESVVPVRPLSLPALDAAPSLETLRDSEAVRLFETRAAARRWDFQLDPNNGVKVARICHYLDGMPLAIELAAAATSFISIDDLAQELVDGTLFLLSRGDPTLPERYRSVDAMIAWSDQLLPPHEQALFRNLAIFVDGWTLEAARAVLGPIVPEHPPLLLLLDHLQRKSLVEFKEHAGRGRYRMLETVRQYARQRLEKSPYYAEVSQRHLDYYLELAESSVSQMDRKAQHAALQRLTSDEKNLRAAQEYSLSTRQAEPALRLTAALARFWFLKGIHQEGYAWLERVLQISEEASPKLRRRALHSAATIVYLRGDYPRAEMLWQECLTLSRELHDEEGVLQAQANLGALALKQERHAQARELYEACAMAYRAAANERGLARMLANLAIVARVERNYHLACTLHNESLTLFRGLEDTDHTAQELNNLADTLIFLGNYQEARDALAEAVTISRSLDNRRHLAHCLTNYVGLAVREEALERAALLMGAEETLRAQIDFPLPLQAQLEYQHDRQQTLSRLGEAAFTVNWNAGARIGLSDLYRYLLNDKELNDREVRG